VLTLDFDALGDTELELLIILEQRAIPGAHPKQHARHEARREVNRVEVSEAEAEREHPREEAFPLLRREEVGPFETSINALLPRCPSADESPEILQRGNSCARLGAARQPTSRRRLDADDGGDGAG
jgi:hypothetical protein